MGSLDGMDVLSIDVVLLKRKRLPSMRFFRSRALGKAAPPGRVSGAFPREEAQKASYPMRFFG